MQCTNCVSDDENWVGKFLRDVWGELFHRADGPSIGSVAEAIVRVNPQKVTALAYPMVQTVPT